jgi:hypothetical protein
MNFNAHTVTVPTADRPVVLAGLPAGLTYQSSAYHSFDRAKRKKHSYCKYYNHAA